MTAAVTPTSTAATQRTPAAPRRQAGSAGASAPIAPSTRLSGPVRIHPRPPGYIRGHPQLHLQPGRLGGGLQPRRVPRLLCVRFIQRIGARCNKHNAVSPRQWTGRWGVWVGAQQAGRVRTRSTTSPHGSTGRGLRWKPSPLAPPAVCVESQPQRHAQTPHSVRSVVACSPVASRRGSLTTRRRVSQGVGGGKRGGSSGTHQCVLDQAHDLLRPLRDDREQQLVLLGQPSPGLDERRSADDRGRRGADLVRDLKAVCSRTDGQFSARMIYLR